MIPDDIRRFILTSIVSVPYLEALLLLRNEAEKSWSAQHVAQRLYLSENSAATLLAELAAARILSTGAEQPPHYRYQPGAELGDIIDRLADIYARQLVEVTHLIHSKIDKKAQQFADAFKWRKDS
jgi:DNA-binding IclR family transcriptional regulator